MTRKAGFRPSSSSDASGGGRKESSKREGDSPRDKDPEEESAPGKQGKGDPPQPQPQPGGGPVIWRSNVRIEDSSTAPGPASEDEEQGEGHGKGRSQGQGPAGGGGHVTMDHDSVECAMCGDVGFAEELRRCALCQFRSQHLYCCVQPNPQGVVVSATGSPTPFLCDWCRLAKPALPLPPAPQQQQEKKALGPATSRAHNVYRPRIMPEKSSRNGKDNGSLRDIPEGSSASEGSDAMDFLVQAALDEDVKQVKQQTSADGLAMDSASNDVPGSDYSACDTVSSTSTIDSVKGPRSSSHRHASVRDRAAPPGDTISSSSSQRTRTHPDLPPSKFRDDSADGRRAARDSASLRSPGFNRYSTSNERSPAAPQAGSSAPSRAPTNGTGTTGTGTGTGGALIWMPPVKLMRGFKKTNPVVASRAPSPSRQSPASSRGLLHRSESLKTLSERKPPPKKAVLQRSESLKSSMTRRKHKVLGDINSVAQPAAVTATATTPSRSSDGDNNFARQLPALKRMRISSNTVEPAAPKGLVRRYKSLSDISC